jgi:hypothetical protein
MKNPLIHYYIFLYPSRKLRQLQSAHYIPPSSPYTAKQETHLLHRLQLDAILVGDYAADLSVFECLCQELRMCDDLPLANMIQLHETAATNDVAVVGQFSALGCRHICQRQSTLRSSVLGTVDHWDLSEEEGQMIREEFEEAFEFLLRAIGLLPALPRRYSLIVLSTPREIEFNRFIRAPAS